jgi:hypothetical protein
VCSSFIWFQPGGECFYRFAPYKTLKGRFFPFNIPPEWPTWHEAHNSPTIEFNALLASYSPRLEAIASVGGTLVLLVDILYLELDAEVIEAARLLRSVAVGWPPIGSATA